MKTYEIITLPKAKGYYVRVYINTQPFSNLFCTTLDTVNAMVRVLKREGYLECKTK